ncbi:MAG TPA: ComEA family DNA-binding protein [Anaerolineae bacterium]|nr:ComEA family DNA-binding protein [Anaerolineae bacterium]
MPDVRPHLPAIIATSFFWLTLFVGYALFGIRQPTPEPIEILPPDDLVQATLCPDPSLVAERTPTPTPAPLRVYVSGAVQKPGVYRLPPDSLVVDAIAAAGGEREDADLIAINLAHPLSDGEQIYVPTQAESQGPPPPIRSDDPAPANRFAGDKEDVPSKPIDLNTATQEELESLPGIGPAMAKRIIEGRPYSSVDDLLRVKGIGEAKLEKLRPYVEVK